MVLIGGTIGSIYSGLVTPTEAAAVGCVLAMIIAVFWGEFSVAILWHALQTTVRVCGNILFIVYAAFLFSYAISYAGVGEQITQFLVDLKLSGWSSSSPCSFSTRCWAARSKASA